MAHYALECNLLLHRQCYDIIPYNCLLVCNTRDVKDVNFCFKIMQRITFPYEYAWMTVNRIFYQHYVDNVDCCDIIVSQIAFLKSQKRQSWPKARPIWIQRRQMLRRPSQGHVASDNSRKLRMMRSRSAVELSIQARRLSSRILCHKDRCQFLQVIEYEKYSL